MAIDPMVRTWSYDPVGLIAWSATVLQMPVLASLAWWAALRDADAANPLYEDASAGHALSEPAAIADEACTLRLTTPELAV